MEPMYCAELSILLHRALEARMETLMNRFSPDWQQEPEALHEVRVASRRVRAVLDLVEPHLYPGYKRQTRKLKRLTRALGRTREADVHLHILAVLGGRQAGPCAGPAMEHALEAIAGQRRKAMAAMAKDLLRLNLKNLPALLQVSSLPDPFRAGDLPGDIWNCLGPWLDGAFPTAALLDQEDARALHLLRIRVKRLRYALEVLAPAFRTPPEAQLKLLKGFQTALGEHHDLATLEVELESLHRGLETRQRPILAAGTLELLTQLDEERLIGFEAFRALAVGTSKDHFIASLRTDLGLEPDREGSASS